MFLPQKNSSKQGIWSSHFLRDLSQVVRRTPWDTPVPFYTRTSPCAIFGYFIFSGISGLVAHPARHNTIRIPAPHIKEVGLSNLDARDLLHVAILYVLVSPVIQVGLSMMNWCAANGGVTNGGLRGVWPPVLEIGRNRPFPPFFCLFALFRRA